MLPPPGFRGVFRSDERARAAYAEAAGIYRILPSAVCLPADTADIALLVRWAAEGRIPLVPRGAGSAMGGGNVGDGIVVDLTRLPPRLGVRPEERVAETGANITLADLNGAADRHGLRLPPDPSSGRWATLGGMVSTNAAGARSVRYGSVRRWVRAVELVTVDGDLLTLRRGEPAPSVPAVSRFEADAAPAIRAATETIGRRFPRTRKNASGYALDEYLASGDLLDLVIGSEGTLGIVTAVEWRLDPVPAHRAGLRIGLRSLDDLVRVVAALLMHEPSAVELLDRTFLDLVRDTDAGTGLGDAEALLLVELERAEPAALRAAVLAAADAVRDRAASVDTALSARAAERLWAVRHAASPLLARLPEERRSLQVIEDACLPIERMGDYIRTVRRLAAVRGIPVVVFGHAGDGHVHVNLLPEVARAGWEGAVATLLDEVSEAVVRLGGTPSGEHGDGRLRAGLLARVYGEEIVDLFRAVKRAFDPLGILAPGVILPSGEPPISRLKVGPGAAALPPDIARALRDIERKGGYGRCRMDLAGERVEGRGSRV
ncbi:MAG TPA: FAD-binding oxidoreductase [Gemmatimonadales bacterium]|nr:FAD-binding oxidoreductase [Gemmatimonadales bacterium]